MVEMPSGSQIEQYGARHYRYDMVVVGTNTKTTLVLSQPLYDACRRI
jgi:hypothetical protein